MTTDRKQTEILPTRQSLLSRLRDMDDRQSWGDFFDLYGKLLHNMARKRGLTEVESQEVLQETLIAVAKTIPTFRYDPSRCSFKSWLRHLLEKKVADQFRRRARAGRDRSEEMTVEGGEGDDPIGNVPDPSTVAGDALWEEEWREFIAGQAIERAKARVSARLFQIFHQLVVLEHSASEVARALDVNIAQVYLAKHRVMAAVKKEARLLEKELG